MRYTHQWRPEEHSERCLSATVNQFVYNAAWLKVHSEITLAASTCFIHGPKCKQNHFQNIM